MKPTIDTVPMPDRPVRVTIPVKVGNNLEDFIGAIRNLADRLGCPQCLSGADCVFQSVRDFVVLPDRTLRESVGGVIIIDGKG